MGSAVNRLHLQAVLIEDVEHLIEDYYQRVQIAPARREALAGMLHDEFDRLMSTEADELAQLTTNRDRLEHEQDRLMQAHYADAIPLAVLKREQDMSSHDDAILCAGISGDFTHAAGASK